MTPYTDADLERDFRAALDVGDPERIDVLAREIDQQGKGAASVPLVAAALWYVENGLQVFPLQPGSKIPMKGSRGCKDATCDPEAVRAWWAANPDANIGLATGRLVDVVDIDGPTGQKSRTELWESTFARIDDDAVAKVLTPRPGGMHVYVPATGLSNAAGIVPGVDIRGAGGYVVAPPSVLDDRPGQHAGRYRFLGDALALVALAGDA